MKNPFAQLREFARRASEDRAMFRATDILTGFGRSVAATPEERAYRAELCVKEFERHLVDFPA